MIKSILTGIDADRVLAIDPWRKGFGFAVLEGTERLLDWGVARVWTTSHRKFLARVETMIIRWLPSVIVLEEILDQNRSPTLVSRVLKIADHSEGRQLPVTFVARSQVSALFAKTGTTRHEIATAIASMFPEEVGHRLPPKPRPWESQPESMRLFAAISFALVGALNLRSEREVAP